MLETKDIVERGGSGVSVLPRRDLQAGFSLRRRIARCIYARAVVKTVSIVKMASVVLMAGSEPGGRYEVAWGESASPRERRLPNTPSPGGATYFSKPGAGWKPALPARSRPLVRTALDPGAGFKPALPARVAGCILFPFVKVISLPF